MTAEMAKAQASGDTTDRRGRGDRDYRGPYGFGRRAHGSQPGAQYGFGESRDSRK
jgi:hypothetical protein